jgi:peroxiredoxin
MRPGDGDDMSDKSHLKRGLALPHVILPATTGAAICLAVAPGLHVLIVYPWTGRPGLPNPPHWDDIPGAHGSTPELEGFRDLAPEFACRNVNLFGLSRQTSDYQREMTTRLNIPFPILSDAEGRMSSALALPSFTTGGEKYLKRLTLVVSAGTIEAVRYPVADPASHASEVLGWLEHEAAAGT